MTSVRIGRRLLKAATLSVMACAVVIPVAAMYCSSKPAPKSEHGPVWRISCGPITTQATPRLVGAAVAPVVTAAPTEFDLLRRVIQIDNGSHGGAGVILKSVPTTDGQFLTYILTAHHVVRGADKDRVSVLDYHYINNLMVATVASYSGHVVEIAPHLDTAIVGVKTAQSLGRTTKLVSYQDLRGISLCDRILTIGTPALEAPSLTDGRIVGLSGTKLRVSSPVAGGNSGGPVFLQDGRLIGMITGIKGMYGPDGRGYLIPHMAVATASPAIVTWLKCNRMGFLVEDDMLAAISFELEHEAH